MSAPPRPAKFVLGRMSPLGTRKKVAPPTDAADAASTTPASASPTQSALQHIWEDPRDPEYGFMLELDAILLSLWGGTETSESTGHLQEGNDAATRQNVAFIMTMAKLLSLPFHMTRWRPKYKRNATSASGHFSCYGLSNAMLNKEAIHLPNPAFERAFCPCSISHPQMLNLKSNAICLAAGAVGNYPLVKHLLDYGKGDGVLVGACLLGQLHLVRTFLPQLREQLGSHFEGFSPFHAAASSGNVALVELLLEMAVQSAAALPEATLTALESSGLSRDQAIARHHQQVKTRALVKMNTLREHCLHIALRSGHAELSLFLLKHKCPADAASLCWAIDDPELHPVADELLKQNADVRSISTLDSQKSPLAAACGILPTSTDRYAWVLLKGQSAHPNVGRVLGMTPLQLAAVALHFPLVKALVEAGADVNAQNDDGETVLHLAAKFWVEEEPEGPKEQTAGGDQAATLPSGDQAATLPSGPERRSYYIPPTIASAAASIRVSAQEEQRMCEEGKALTALTTLKYLVSRGADVTIANHAATQRAKFLKAHNAGDARTENDFTSWRLAKDIARTKGRSEAFRALLE